MSYPRFFFLHFIHSTTFFVVLAFCEAQRPNPIRSCLLCLTVMPCGFPLTAMNDKHGLLSCRCVPKGCWPEDIDIT